MPQTLAQAQKGFRVIWKNLWQCACVGCGDDIGVACGDNGWSQCGGGTGAFSRSGSLQHTGEFSTLYQKVECHALPYDRQR